MKLLLDECVPRRLKNDFRYHDVKTVADVGLSGVTNGELLREAVSQDFDVLITIDQNILYQQNISQFDLALIVLRSKPCRYPQLRSLVPKVLACLNTIEKRTTRIIQ